MPLNDQKTYLTKAGLNKLKGELTELKDERRPAVIGRIKEAVSYGDLSENSEYEDAKNEQGFIEGRIAELEKILQTAEIVSAASSNGVVALGSTVKVKQNGNSATFTIVGPAEADPAGGLISHESPLGEALLGKSVGDQTSVETPKGATTYKIVSIS